MYITYTICSHYHDTTMVEYCVPYLQNMLPLRKCYQGSILCILPTQYAHIIILLPHYHTTKVVYCVPYLHNMPPLSYITTPLLLYYQRSILCALPTQYVPIIIIVLR